MSRTVSILEFVTNTAPLRVDREKGILYGVKLLGEASQNQAPRDNLYPKTTRAKAITLLEGRRVYVNHPRKSEAGETRRYEDGMGVARAVEERGDGLYGNYHFNPKHPLAEQLFWDAEHAPGDLGFSINGNGKTVRRNGRNLVEEITELFSVDLVSRPATTKGLFESRTMFQTLAELLETLKGTPQGVTLKEMADAAGLPSDAPMDAPAPSSPDDAIKSGFKAAIHAVVDDDSMDMQAKLQKIKEILKAQEKLMGGDKKPDEGGDKGGDKPDKPAAESKAGQGNLQEQLRQLQRKDAVRDLCEAAGVKPSAALLKAACAVDQETAAALIEEAKSASAGAASTTPSGQKPRSQGPTVARPLVEVKIPEKAADWARSLVE